LLRLADILRKWHAFERIFPAVIRFCRQSSGCSQWEAHQARVPNALPSIPPASYRVQHFDYRSAAALRQSANLLSKSQTHRGIRPSHYYARVAPAFHFRSPALSFQPPPSASTRPDSIPPAPESPGFRIASRQLNSITLGPIFVSINPMYKNPGNAFRPRQPLSRFNDLFQWCAAIRQARVVGKIRPIPPCSGPDCCRMRFMIRVGATAYLSPSVSKIKEAPILPMLLPTSPLPPSPSHSSPSPAQ